MSSATTDVTKRVAVIFQMQGMMDKEKKLLRTIMNNCRVITEQKNLKIACQNRIFWAFVAGVQGHLK